MAWKVAAGEQGGPDMANSDLFLGWAFNPFYSSYMGARRAMALKEKGLKFLIVDTRRTPTSEKLADLFLQPARHRRCSGPRHCQRADPERLDRQALHRQIRLWL